MINVSGSFKKKVKICYRTKNVSKTENLYHDRREMGKKRKFSMKRNLHTQMFEAK